MHGSVERAPGSGAERSGSCARDRHLPHDLQILAQVSFVLIAQLRAVTQRCLLAKKIIWADTPRMWDDTPHVCLHDHRMCPDAVCNHQPVSEPAWHH
jgi:hypothetical protein